MIFLEDLGSIEDLTEELYYSKMKSVENNFNKLKDLLSSEDYFVKNYIRGDL